METAAPAATIPTPATPDLCTAQLLVDGVEVPGTIHIASMAVVRELNRIPSATLHVEDGNPASGTFAVGNADYFVPGKKVEIRLGYRAQHDPVFKGIVVKYSVKIRKSGSFLIVECRDEAVKMTAGRKSHYYADQKDSDILEELIGRYNLKAEVTATGAPLPEVVQYDATDWDFALCRAEANGLLVMVEDGTVRMAPPDPDQTPVVAVTYGTTLLEFDAEVDARLQSAGIRAHSWSAADQELVEAEAAEPTVNSPGNLTSAALAEVLGSEPRELRHGGHLAAPELQTWADSRLLRERLAKVRGRVRFQGFAGVLPGKLLEMAGVGERLQGQVLVAGVRHQFAGGNWETDVQFGLSPEPFAETFNLRPLPAAGLLPAVSGLHTGIVTRLGGDPEGEDRIKVCLPLINPQEEGTWARIATLDAGQDRGTYFRPEIGDEVIVGFLHDDPRHPVVLGMCHSSRKPAPQPPTDDNHEKGYVSRAKLKMTFDDDKKVMAFETPAGKKLTFSDEENAIRLEDENGNKIILDDKGITLESSKDLILKAASTGNLQAEGNNVNLKAQQAFKAEGSGSAELSSGASTTLKGGATTVIKGGMVQIN